MKQKKLFFKFDLGAFPSILYVAVGYNSIYDLCKKLKIEPDQIDEVRENDGAESLASTYGLPNGNCCLLFNHNILSINDVCLVVHEVMHATQFVLGFYDINLTEDTSEVYAYTAQCIFREITSHFKEIKVGWKVKLKDILLP